MKESVLILGAGLMQKPAIEAAKKLGFKVFVVDANPDAEAVPYCDVFKKIDLKDREGIAEYAVELKNSENLKAVFTAGTDFSASVSYAQQKAGLSGHSFEACLNASQKNRMRKCFQDANVPSPEFYWLENDESKAEEYVKKLGFPCVVKPTDNMGARGCRMIRSDEEIKASVQNAMNSSRSRTIILEKYMDGPEFSIDALLYQGTLTITGFADRHIFYPPYFIETGHTMPSVFDEKKQLELIAVFALGIKALGLTEGAAKADIKYTEKGPEIGEIAARLSGGYMSGWTYPYSSDLNLTEQALLIAAGKTPEKLLEKRKKIDFVLPENLKGAEKPFELYAVPSEKVSAERAWISIPGVIKNITGLENTESFENVQNVFPRPVKSGDKVEFPRNNVSKCGNVISLSKDYESAVSASEKACSEMFIHLEPNNPETERFLKGECQIDESGFPPNAFEAYSKLEKIDLSGEIPENESVIKNASQELLDLLKIQQKDWNYVTAYQTCEKFDKLYEKHPKMNKERFFKALFKGGLQACVYVMESRF